MTALRHGAVDPHEHRWTIAVHLDGCHYYTSTYTCPCGATASSTRERDPTEDPYSLVWMEPPVIRVNRDERGRYCTPRWVERPCERCQALQKGAQPKFDLVITDNRGNVLKEERR
jgi:hypothetical protein